MYDKIVNPKTGRKVSIYGRIGKKVLRNYIIKAGGGKKSCHDVEKMIDIDKKYKCENDHYGLNFLGKKHKCSWTGTKCVKKRSPAPGISDNSSQKDEDNDEFFDSEEEPIDEFYDTQEASFEQIPLEQQLKEREREIRKMISNTPRGEVLGMLSFFMDDDIIKKLQDGVITADEFIEAYVQGAMAHQKKVLEKNKNKYLKKETDLTSF